MSVAPLYALPSFPETHVCPGSDTEPGHFLDKPQFAQRAAVHDLGWRLGALLVVFPSTSERTWRGPF